VKAFILLPSTPLAAQSKMKVFSCGVAPLRSQGKGSHCKKRVALLY